MKLLFLFLLVILLAWKAPDLLAQERGSENGVITMEQYCTFLNAEQALDCRLQTTGSEETANHSDKFLGTITASNLNDFYDERMQGSSIMRTGFPGNYCYKLISTASTDSFNSYMAGLSWNDAVRYCDWKNHSTSTYNVNSCAISAANVDLSLKSNVLTFRLISTEMVGYQAGEVEVATMCGDLVDDLLEITFGLVGLGACRSGNPEELTRKFPADRLREPRSSMSAALGLESSSESVDSHRRRQRLSSVLPLKETCAAMKGDPSVDSMNKVGKKIPEFLPMIEEENPSSILAKRKLVAFNEEVFVRTISTNKNSQGFPKSEAQQKWDCYHKTWLDGWKKIKAKARAVSKGRQMEDSVKQAARAPIYEKDYPQIKNLLREALALIKNNNELQNPTTAHVLADMGIKTIYMAEQSIVLENLRTEDSEDENVNARVLEVCEKLQESMGFLTLSDNEIIEKEKEEAHQAFRAASKEFLDVGDKRKSALSEVSAQARLDYPKVCNSFDECKKRLDAVRQGDPKIIADEARRSVVDKVLSLIETVEQVTDDLQAMLLSRKVE